jgi:signal transduction histidine kinase
MENTGAHSGIEELLKQSLTLHKNEPRKALELADEAYRLSELIGYEEGKALSLNRAGQSCSILSDYTAAISKFNEALKIISVEPENPLHANIFHNMGIVYKNLGRYEEALNFYIKSLEIKKRAGDRLGEAYSLNNIGIVYKSIDNLEQALDYLLKSLSIKEELGDEKSIYNTLSNIGVVYLKLSDYRSARDFIFKGLHLMRKFNDRHAEANALNNLGMTYKEEGDYEKALKYYHKSLEIDRQIGDRHSESNAVNNIGLLYIFEGKYDEAVEAFLNAYELSAAISNKRGEANSLCNLGEAYCHLSRYDEAIEHVEKGLDIAREINVKELEAQGNRTLAQVYEKTGDFEKALLHLKYYNDVDKEISSDIIRSKTKGLMVQYDVEKHQKEAELNRLRNVELLNAINKMDMINQEKNNFIGIVSHDIRDPVSSIYSLSDFIMADIDDLSKEEIVDFAKDIKYSSDKIIRLLQALLDINAIETGRYNLKFEKFGLSALLKQVVSSYNERALEKKIKIRFTASQEYYVFCDKNSAEQLFSNLISNAVKYSPQGRNVFISVKEENGFIRTEIEDEGPGFNSEDMKKLFEKFAKLSARPTGGESSTGLGLSIVKQLVEMNKGKIFCESEYLKGAKFLIDLPVFSSGAGKGE